MESKCVLRYGLSFVAGILAYKVYTYGKKRNLSHAVPDYYETKDLLDQYLCFHYGRAQHTISPIDALDFAKRVADECIRVCPV